MLQLIRMKFLRKHLPIVAVSATLTAAITTFSIVYFTTGDVPSIVDQKRYSLRQNSKLAINGYFFDLSQTYGGIQNKTTDTLLTGHLIRRETSGETKIEQVEEIDKDGNKKIVSKIKEPSYSKLVFEIASSIIIEFYDSDGKYYVKRFDSDAVDKSKKHKNEATVDLSDSVTTLNSNSINSETFKKLISNKIWNDKSVWISSINFTTKKDAHWVDWRGNKWLNKDGLESNIKPEDFYYSFMRTKLHDYKYRLANGGTAELDEHFVQKTATTVALSSTYVFPNEYLFGFFGADSIKFANKNQTVRKFDSLSDEFQKLINKETDYKESVFSLHATNDSLIGSDAKGMDAYGVISKMFLDSKLLSPAPSDLIKELAENDALNSTPAGKIQGKAREFGIYTHGIDREDNLFAGAYVPIEAKDNRIVFALNKNFARKEFVKDKRAIQQFIFEYTTGVDKYTFQDQVFNNFRNKTLSELKFNDLSPAQKRQIWGSDPTKDYIKNGLLFTKEFNKSSLVQQSIPVSAPAACTNSDHYDENGKHIELSDDERKHIPYTFGENYSKVIYGSSHEELWTGQVGTGSSFYSELGIKLRSYINASINWYTFIQDISAGLKTYWVSHAAPDANYSDTNNLTPYSEKSATNSLGYYDSVSKSMKWITPKMFENHWRENQSNIVEQIRSPAFNEIQKLIKTTLDEAYKKAGLSNNQKLEWDFWYTQSNQNEIITSKLNFVIENVIKKLDARLAPKLRIPKDGKELVKGIDYNHAITDFAGWGYDYEGIGSYLDGISRNKGVNIIPMISMFAYPQNENSAEHQWRISNFPNFKILSDQIVKWFNKEMFEKLYQQDEENKKIKSGESLLRPQNWQKLNNNQLYVIDEAFRLVSGTKVVQPISFTIEYSKALRDFQDTYSKPDAQSQKLATVSWYKYEVDPSNPTLSNIRQKDENIGFKNLIRELNILQGPHLEEHSSIIPPESSGMILVQNEYDYPTPLSGVLFMQDIKLPRKDKN